MVDTTIDISRYYNTTLQLRTLRLRELKRQIQAHTAGKRQIESRFSIGFSFSKSGAFLRL